MTQCLGQPTLIALAFTIQRNRKSYYSVLERANKNNEITDWLSAEKYISITKTSRATATRDLADLVSIGAFEKTGQLKGTRYLLKLG